METRLRSADWAFVLAPKDAEEQNGEGLDPEAEEEGMRGSCSSLRGERVMGFCLVVGQVLFVSLSRH